MTAGDGSRGPGARLAGLADDERVLWLAQRGRRAPRAADLFGALVFLGIVGALVGGMVTMAFVAAGPDAGSPDPVAAASTYGVGGAVVGIVLAVLLVRPLRRAVLGTPPVASVVTDRRAAEIDRPDGRARVAEEVALDALPQLTRRVPNRGPAQLSWDVLTTQSSRGSDMSGHRPVGFLDLTADESREAERTIVEAKGATSPSPVTLRQATMGPHHEQLLAEVVHPGERVTWREPGRLPVLVERWSSQLVLGAVVFLFIVFGFCSDGMWSVVGSISTTAGLVAVGVVVLFGLVVLTGLLRRAATVHRAHQAATNPHPTGDGPPAFVAVRAVTDRRALIAQRDGSGALVVNTFLPQHVATLQVRPGQDGTTTFVLGRSQHPEADDLLSSQNAFSEVRDGAGAHAALQALLGRSG